MAPRDAVNGTPRKPRLIGPRYPQITPGERVTVNWRRYDYKMACCDCGLVHRLRFSVKGPILAMRAWRDNRATAQLRRRTHAP